MYDTFCKEHKIFADLSEIYHKFKCKFARFKIHSLNLNLAKLEKPFCLLVFNQAMIVTLHSLTLLLKLSKIRKKVLMHFPNLKIRTLRSR